MTPQGHPAGRVRSGTARISPGCLYCIGCFPQEHFWSPGSLCCLVLPTLPHRRFSTMLLEGENGIHFVQLLGSLPSPEPMSAILLPQLPAKCSPVEAPRGTASCAHPPPTPTLGSQSRRPRYLAQVEPDEKGLKFEPSVRKLGTTRSRGLLIFLCLNTSFKGF